MRKMITGLLTGVLLAGMLSGCSARTVTVQKGSSSSDSASANIEVVPANGQMIIYTAELPQQYFITYEITGEDGVIETLSKAVDGEGNVYYKSDQEYLFLKEGEGYSLYMGKRGELAEQENKYTAGYIDELTKEFDEYVKKGNVSAVGITELVGEGTVAGRKCNVYSMSVKVVNFQQTYQFAVDQETLGCLEWRSEKNIAGFAVEGDGSFTCVRFDTGDIDLRINNL